MVPNFLNNFLHLKQPFKRPDIIRGDLHSHNQSANDYNFFHIDNVDEQHRIEVTQHRYYDCSGGGRKQSVIKIL